MIRRKIKQAAFGMSLLSILMMTGCLDTPDMEYVTNKEGQDSLISDHAVTDNGIPISQQVHAPERATGSCEKVNEYTSIEVDAKVVVPSATTVPVYTVSPIKLDAEAAKHYTGTLFETGEFYNREYDNHMPTYLSVDDLYEWIESITNTLETAKITNASEPVLDEEGNVIEMNEEYAQSLSDSLVYFQELLETAKEQPTYGSEVSYDFETETSKIVVPQRQGNGYVLDAEGETVDYEFQSLCFTGRHNGIEYDLSLYQDGLNTEIRYAMPSYGRLSNGYMLSELFLNTEYNGNYITKPNTCNYSEEEAVALCQDFLAELGITNMETQYITDIYLFHDYSFESEVFLGRKGWEIFMYWGTEDMSDDFLPDNYWTRQTLMSTSKEAVLPLEMNSAYLNELYGEENYGEIRAWNGVAVFTVLDDGIIDAWIQNPVENKELLAEHVTLLEFDQVFKQGLAQLETLYGDSGVGYGPGRQMDIKITVIELNYARMQSPDTEGEFAMIPVWDFKTGADGESMVSINAIDGSVFDRTQGH